MTGRGISDGEWPSAEVSVGGLSTIPASRMRSIWGLGYDRELES